MLEEYNYLENMTPQQIAALLSLFSNIRVPDEKKMHLPPDHLDIISKAALYISKSIDDYANIELRNRVDTGENCDIHFDLMETIIEWYQAENEKLANILYKEYLEIKRYSWRFYQSYP